MSWPGNTFHITDPLWEESTSHWWIPLIKGQWCRDLMFPLWLVKLSCWITVELSVISDDLMLTIMIEPYDNNFFFQFVQSHWCIKSMEYVTWQPSPGLPSWFPECSQVSATHLKIVHLQIKSVQSPNKLLRLDLKIGHQDIVPVITTRQACPITHTKFTSFLLRLNFITLSCQFSLQVEDNVCGTDGVTYMNECELRVASCRRQQYIGIASPGPCGKIDFCHIGFILGYIFIFIIISWHWADTDLQNPSLWKSRTDLSCEVYTNAADDLAMQWMRASAAVVLAKLPQNILLSAPEELRIISHYWLPFNSLWPGRF